ncbi:unnamed protein product [Leuciscus chuanchicus]
MSPEYQIKHYHIQTNADMCPLEESRKDYEILETSGDPAVLTGNTHHRTDEEPLSSLQLHLSDGPFEPFRSGTFQHDAPTTDLNVQPQIYRKILLQFYKQREIKDNVICYTTTKSHLTSSKSKAV